MTDRWYPAGRTLHLIDLDCVTPWANDPRPAILAYLHTVRPSVHDHALIVCGNRYRVAYAKLAWQAAQVVFVRHRRPDDLTQVAKQKGLDPRRCAARFDSVRLVALPDPSIAAWVLALRRRGVEVFPSLAWRARGNDRRPTPGGPTSARGPGRRLA